MMNCLFPAEFRLVTVSAVIFALALTHPLRPVSASEPSPGATEPPLLLTAEEREAGEKALARAEAARSTLSTGVLRCLNLLESDKSFYRVFARYHADYDDTSRLIDFIKACRRRRIWSMIETLSTFLSHKKKTSPRFLRLRAHAAFKMGKNYMAEGLLNDGIKKYPFNRLLRLQLAKLESFLERDRHRTRIKTLKEFTETADFELCFRRSDIIDRALVDYNIVRPVGQRRYIEQGKTSCAEMEDILSRENLLPPDYLKSDCVLVSVYSRESGRTFTICTKHANRHLIKKGVVLFFDQATADDKLLLEVFRSGKPGHVVLAAEMFLSPLRQLKPRQEKIIADLLSSPRLETVRFNLLKSLLPYLRCRELHNDRLKETLGTIYRDSTGPRHTLAALELFWVTGTPVNLNTGDILNILGLRLLKRGSMPPDAYKFLTICLKNMGLLGELRLKEACLKLPPTRLSFARRILREL